MTIDLGFFLGKYYFGNDGSQNYLIFQRIADPFIILTGDTETFTAWKFGGLSNESISSVSAENSQKRIHSSKKQ